jgi:hypothetical protein
MPTSISRGSLALVGLPKFGDVITPEGFPKFVRLNHVRKDVQVLSCAGGARRRFEKESLRYVEAERELFGGMTAVARHSRRTVVDLSVPVVIPAGRDVVVPSTVRGHRPGKEDAQRQLSIHGSAELMPRKSAGAAPVRRDVVIIRRQVSSPTRRAVGAHFLCGVIHRHVQETEPFSKAQAKHVA